MKKHLLIATILGVVLSTAQAQVPQLISFQGRVAVGGTYFTGTGQFKFALVNGTGATTYWSNDGTSNAGSQPTTFVSLSVSNGLYSVLLGNATMANMTVVPATVFTNSDVRLRVWFNDGVSGFQQMSPDQRIAAVGYAMMAGNVSDGVITSSKLAPGAVGSGQLASNLTISGTVTAAAFQGNGAGLTGIPSAIPYQTVAGTTQQAQANAGYFVTNVAPVTITLPASPNIGDIVRVSGMGTGGWIIGQNVGQSILASAFSAPRWTQTSAPTNLSWQSIASSSDGTKLVAVVERGGIYTSNNSGVTWVQTSAPSTNWTSVSSSADGAKLVAVGRSIYTSTNSGATWVQTSAPSANWYSVASSADGTKLVALIGSGGIYTSTNSGTTWTLSSAPTNQGWQSVASSADGTKLIAVGNNIYTSTNSGATWIQRSSPSNSGWQSVASSADGTKVVVLLDKIYTSTDSGATLTPTSAPYQLGFYWRCIASSADGTKLVAVNSSTGLIYTSCGTLWSANSAPNLEWQSVASSADGTKLVAMAFSGGIYTTRLPVATTPGGVGYLQGGQNSAIELQYIGNGQFNPISYTGAIYAY